MRYTPAAHSGFSLPVMGFGTWRLWGEPGVQTVRQAIEIGYRLIDTARVYDNEGAVGRAIATSGVVREELVITSKVPPSHQQRSVATSAIAESVYRLGLDYLDLYLIHWRDSENDRSVEAWEALIEARDRGLVRTIGVSNFRERDIERLVEATEVLPEVNQIELHPYRPREGLLAFHAQYGILTEAWAPLGHDESLLHDPVLVHIARAHDATPAQVALAWSMHRGAVPIPKATSLERQRENLEAQTLVLSDSETREIEQLKRRD